MANTCERHGHRFRLAAGVILRTGEEPDEYDLKCRVCGEPNRHGRDPCDIPDEAMDGTGRFPL